MNEAEIAEVVERHFDARQSALTVPELAFGFAIEGRTVASRNGRKPFRIASMTKSFTAAATLLLRDQGVLQLDQPIVEISPALRGIVPPTSDSPAITVRHLLTMSSGMANDDPWGDRQLGVSNEQLQSMFDSGAYFASNVGADYVYCNYGYAMLGHIIATVTGASCQQFVAAELLTPLGLHSTTWDEPTGDHAMPHRLRDGSIVDEGQLPLANGGFAPMGGLWSTIDDLLVWTQFLMDGFPPRDGDEGGPLARASRREMQRMWTYGGNETVEMLGEKRTFIEGYGMGLEVLDDPELGRISYHSGGLPGYGSNMMWLPDRRVAAVHLANRTYAPMYRANTEVALLLLRAGALPEPMSVSSAPLEPHAKSLLELLQSWDDARADQIFEDNLALDESYERRRADAQRLVTSGMQVGRIQARNAAVGDIFVVDESGKEVLKIYFSLASHNPSRIQTYLINPA